MLVQEDQFCDQAAVRNDLASVFVGGDVVAAGHRDRVDVDLETGAIELLDDGRAGTGGVDDKALRGAGYDTSAMEVLIRSDMPSGYAAMSLHDGATLGAETFSSQSMLTHALEEELLHIQRGAAGLRTEYAPGTVKALEEAADVQRKFPLPSKE